VLDPSILRLVDVTSGLADDGILITNTKYSGPEIRNELGVQQAIGTVNGTQIAMEEMGLPIPNTTMLGSLLKARSVVNPDSVIEPLKKRFGRIAEKKTFALFKEHSKKPK
jgi:pyruvate ferredoxin oxidoreductase gamma subunit